jgi:ABC-type dipeptide/oligopeptide/nickel transport system ATPase subunit
MSSVLIEGKNIYKGYRNGLIGRKQIILHDCSIRVYTGETVGICGSSGSGKSTLGRILAGLEMPDHGEVLFEGVNLFHATQNTKKTTRRKIQVLFQDPGGSFNPVRKLEDSMKRVLMLSGVTKPREEIDDVLRKVGLHAEILSRYPHEISGGQAQRLALARILITRPELIILDEPTSGLDVSVQAQILWLLKALKMKEHSHIS